MADKDMDTCEALGQKAYDAARYLLSRASAKPGSLLVLGCSTSEIAGGVIGKQGSPALGQAIVRGVLDAARQAGVALCVQCCEHLNRALVMPRDVALARGYAPVWAVPHPHAGGSAASAYYRMLESPAVVEAALVDAGLDIGETLIGMHLHPVAVPLRPENPFLGKARLTMAYTRPKYIGGPRTHYTLEDTAQSEP